ncbi:uncharacterized protein LOC134050790 [Cinclus cinclus]|uniref:uncharacterized protein LOC134050790 n=1 Tax=Cinclus cinclus TaxID=127875 RepID=UPI002E10889E
MPPPQPGRIPQQGPVYQRRQPAHDSASSAELTLPPGTRESPPHHPRRRHAQRDAPVKCGGKRGIRANGSSGRWEIRRTGNSPSKISGSLRASFVRAREAGSTKQCQGSAGSQRCNPATRSQRMSIQSQLASPRRSCQIQLATFPPWNSHPGAVATREGHPPVPSTTNPASRGSVREQSPHGRAQCPVPSPAHTLCMCSTTT